MKHDKDYDPLEHADMLNKEAKENYKETTKIEMGRFRYVRLNGSFYIKLMTNKFINDVITNPLPDDSRFVRCGHDDLGMIFLVFESQQFDMIYENEQIPFHGDMLFKRNPVIGRVQ